MFSEHIIGIMCVDIQSILFVLYIFKYMLWISDLIYLWIDLLRILWDKYLLIYLL